MRHKVPQCWAGVNVPFVFAATVAACMLSMILGGCALSATGSTQEDGQAGEGISFSTESLSNTSDSQGDSSKAEDEQPSDDSSEKTVSTGQADAQPTDDVSGDDAGSDANNATAPADDATTSTDNATSPADQSSTQQGVSGGTDATVPEGHAYEAASNDVPAATQHPLVSATGSSINVRALPQHQSGLVATVGPQTPMYPNGSVSQGYGSDGIMHDWYYVVVPDVGEGWVRSDLVQEGTSYEESSQNPATTTVQTTRLTSGTGDALNLRAEPQHESALVVQVTASTVLLFYGQTGQGYGSDGELHTWYYVEAPDYSAWGWVRSDLTKTV